MNLNPADQRQGDPEPAATDTMPSATRADWLADVLRRRIMEGVYKPGERIRESALQQEFGISNGPTREALQQIVADGIAERAPWRGVSIVELDKGKLIELFQVRLALLEYAAELAARKITPAGIAQAEALKLELNQTFDDISSQAASHPSFSGQLSKWLLSVTGNALMQELWKTAMLRTLVYVNLSLRSNSGAESRRHINCLIDAIVAGQPGPAREAARALTRQTLHDLDIDGEV
ncbi:MAG: GntR family transcriptional regulator [Polaromonas sp.]|nr:GntR family transcriptional regulator [Polaromonas sp.]